MSKFCSNCGNALNEEADICLGCGKFIIKENYKPIQNVQKDPRNGKGIASLITSIFCFIYTLSLFSTPMVENDEPILLLFFAIGLGISITSLCLASSERKYNKNGINTAGLVISIIALVFTGFLFTIFAIFLAFTSY